MGRGRFLSLILLCCTISAARAQAGYDFRQLDSITYAKTLTEDWKEVISVGKLALENDIDYFYLRLRMGIAYFNRENYRLAIKHLEKADGFNPENGLNKEYLYYAYLYSGQLDKVALIAGNLNERMHEVSGIEPPNVFSEVYLETGPEFSDNFDKNGFNQLPKGQNQRVQNLYGNSYYTHLGIKLRLHPRISIYAGYSNLQISKKAELQYEWNSPDSIVEHEWGFAKYFPLQSKIETSTYDYTLRQNSAYLKANIQADGGWSITPAIHYINVKTESIGIANESMFVQDTAYYIPDIDSVAYFYYDQIKFEIQPSQLILNNVVLSLGINKQVSVFDLGVFGSWSNLNDLYQYQYGLSISYFPFGNLNFYGNTMIKGLTEGDNTEPIFSQMLGVKLARFLWMEGFGTFGNLRGTNESNAFVVYNLSDEISLKTGLNLTFVISPAIQLSFRYQYLQKQGYRSVSGQNNPGG